MTTKTSGKSNKNLVHKNICKYIKSSNVTLLKEIRNAINNCDNSRALQEIKRLFTFILTSRYMRSESTVLSANRCKEDRVFLRSLYETIFKRLMYNMKIFTSTSLQIKCFRVIMDLMSLEGRYPLDGTQVVDKEKMFPVKRLKRVLQVLLSQHHNQEHLLKKFVDYLKLTDVQYFTWKILPGLTLKSNCSEVYMLNYLRLLEKIPVEVNSSVKLLCADDGDIYFKLIPTVPIWSINTIWKCLMQWRHTKSSHQRLLIVLLECLFSYIEKPLLLTDFLMDSLDMNGQIALLAFQGILILIQQYNLNYPDVYTKLYTMLQPEIFQMKYKVRLFQLTDTFLRSICLPEMLVAAFVKRLARLALIAPSEDTVLICKFINNLILRHPALKCLINNCQQTIHTDPYIFSELDPLKSKAIQSSLWEIKTLQLHINPVICQSAEFLNVSLRTNELDMKYSERIINEDLFDAELKKQNILYVIAFEKPINDARLVKGEQVMAFWTL